MDKPVSFSTTHLCTVFHPDHGRVKEMAITGIENFSTLNIYGFDGSSVDEGENQIAFLYVVLVAEE